MKKLKIVLFALTIALISACGSEGTNTPVPPTQTQAPIVTPEFSAYVQSFEVYDVDLGKSIYEIQNGDVLDVNGLNYTIKINTNPQEIQRIEMFLNDELFRTEYFWPYSLSHNEVINGVERHEKVNLTPGNYNLKVIVYNNNLTGETKTISFSIVMTPTQTPSQPLNPNWNFDLTSQKEIEYYVGCNNVPYCVKKKIINVPDGWMHTYENGLYPHQIDKTQNGLMIWYHDSQGKTTLKTNFDVQNIANVVLNLRYRWEIFNLRFYKPEDYVFKIYLNDQLLNQNFYAYNNFNNNDVNFPLTLEPGNYELKLEFISPGNGSGHLFLEHIRIENAK